MSGTLARTLQREADPGNQQPGFTVSIYFVTYLKIKTMKTIFDVFRWLTALIILCLVTNYSSVGILYVFEFIVKHLSHSRILYIWFMIPALALCSILIWFLLAIVYKLIITFIVRQSTSFSIVFGVLFAATYIGFLILFWSGIIKLSWEIYNFPTINKVLFTLFVGGIALTLPPALYGSIKGDLR